MNGSSLRGVEGYLARRGVRLYWWALLPEGAPQATVAFVHGLGEHSGRHRGLAEFLANQGYAALLFDLRGAGRSGGLRGHVHRFDDYLADLQALLDLATSSAGLPAVGRVPAPAVAYGQSLGGLIALAYALAHPESVQAVVASSPALGEKLKPPAWKEALAGFLAFVSPGLRLPTGLMPEDLAHDPRVAAEYRADPLCYDKASAGWYREFKQARAGVYARAGELGCPVLLLQGGADQIVNPETTERFYQRLNCPNKRFVRYEDAYHEVFNEACRDEARGEVAAWLETVVKTGVDR